MIILLDTSTPVCHVKLIDGERQFHDSWEADRQLAHGLLKYLHDQLTDHNWSWDDITGIGVLQGPGSFTGLRIGLTVMNTIASSQLIPIVGTRGDNWQAEALQRLENSENDQIILPFYGAEANITKPRK